MAKRPRYDMPESGGETTPGHYGRDRMPAPSTEQLPCLVVRATADGYVVGRAIVDASAVTWLSPRHERPWIETRPQDVRIPALKEANIGGNVELKPARLVKGVPVAQTVAWHIVFGEMLDAAVHRAREELRRQFDALVKGRRSWWRHKCAKHEHNHLPVWLGVPLGETCPHCGATEPKPKATVAA